MYTLAYILTHPPPLPHTLRPPPTPYTHLRIMLGMFISGILMLGNVSNRLDKVVDRAAMLFLRLLSMSSITPPICAMLLRIEKRTSFTLPDTWVEGVCEGVRLCMRV